MATTTAPVSSGSQQFCVRWNSYHSNLQAVFPRLLSTERFADVTLACGGRQLRCHKVVLSACSAYFERLLLQNPCKHPIIFMKDMRWLEMRALVEFMYRGEVNVTQDELPSLLKSAEALQIRGLCSSEGAGAGGGAGDVTLASQHNDVNGNASGSEASSHKKRRSTEPEDKAPLGPATRSAALVPAALGAPVKEEAKEETVEEDGLYYGEIEEDGMEFDGQDEDSKAGSSLTQPSDANFLRVKPENLLLGATDIRQKNEAYLAQLANMDAAQIQREFAKYGFHTSDFSNKSEKFNFEMNEKNKHNFDKDKPDFDTHIRHFDIDKTAKEENDFYKSWLEQNGELEVSLLRVSEKNKKQQPKSTKSEVELIPKSKSLLEKTLTSRTPTLTDKMTLTDISKMAAKPLDMLAKDVIVPRRRGRPPIFKEKGLDIGESVLKQDLDQFLEGKEVSSSGLSRKDLERVMMGKFNPNRRYSNEAMWAALMDVKKGGSIYRAAQTHKVPRKSLRNWMKRCHIKSSFPMPQQLKQFVENNKKQKDSFKHFPHVQHLASLQDRQTELYEENFDFGKHFLTFSSNTLSSDEETPGFACQSETAAKPACQSDAKSTASCQSDISKCQNLTSQITCQSDTSHKMAANDSCQNDSSIKNEPNSNQSHVDNKIDANVIDMSMHV